MIMAVVVGLCTKKSTPLVWIGMTAWILAVMINYYVKN